MSKYTTELRFLITDIGKDELKSWFMDYNLYDYLSQDKVNVINKSGLWSKDRLAEEILDRFYLEEIGFETPALFKHYAKITMKRVMEKYLPIIYSNCLEFDVLSNIKVTERFTHSVETSGESDGSSSSGGSGLSVNSDTPQGQINKTEILTGKYASNTQANESESSSEDHSSNTANSTETYEKIREGMSGINYSAPELLTKFRSSIISVNDEIMDILETKLFMLIY